MEGGGAHLSLHPPSRTFISGPGTVFALFKFSLAMRQPGPELQEYGANFQLVILLPYLQQQ